MRKKIRSIHIILFVTFFLVGSFIDISTIRAEAGSRTGSIQIILYHYKIPVQKQEKNKQNNCLHLRRKIIFPA
ncbi:hypothetical protein [Coprococcus sp. LG100-32]|uniref:hypothetical protein n=1 Tax=Coprococcus sp. LG100-32 TaxID=2997994 RepID=UPI0022E866E9|nr:hypothetical protein [Coprococcus sp. LG100-32]